MGEFLSFKMGFRDTDYGVLSGIPSYFILTFDRVNLFETFSLLKNENGSESVRKICPPLLNICEHLFMKTFYLY